MGDFLRKLAAASAAAGFLFLMSSCGQPAQAENDGNIIFIKAEKAEVSEMTECPEQPELPEDAEPSEPILETEISGTDGEDSETDGSAAGTVEEEKESSAGQEDDMTWTGEPAPSDTEEEDSSPPLTDTAYTFTDVSKTVYAAVNLNIRSGPSTAFDVIGSYDAGQAVSVTGVCSETGWYRVDLNGASGYCDAGCTVDAVTAAQPESGTENTGNAAASSSGTVSAGDSGVTQNWVDLCIQAYESAPQWVRSAFESAGWQIKVRSGTWWPAYGYSMQLKGLTAYGEKTIYISGRNDSCNAHTVCHELGHFVDLLYGQPSRTAEFQNVYSAEYRQFCSYFSYSNGYPGAEELFAEGLWHFWTDPGNLAYAAPGTYTFIQRLLG